tara:strand:- start:789 stop:1235 length:447 start_codon:yes stop_codon:yes gene_type:complete
MIITCEKCTKNFSIKDDLIPNEGRLLQCGRCDHKWFYKKPKQNLNIDHEVEKIHIDKKPAIKKSIKKEEEIKKEDKYITYKSIKKPKKKSNLIKIIIVIIISIIALIIFIDTFKLQLEKYIPGINFILNNLYETLKDLLLFAKDLLNR